MFGFMFGTACLIGLIFMLKRGRRWGRGGCGRGDWHNDAAGRGRRGFGALNLLFRRLDTSPGQEKTIHSAVDELEDRGRQARQELARSREQLADAMRSDYFDPEKLGEIFARHDTELEELRKVAVSSLSRVHEALDERQRRELADMIGEGFWSRRPGGPYRSWS